MSNKVQRFNSREEIPLDEIQDFLKKATEDDNAILLIATNDVKSRHENCPAEILTIKINPDVVAGAIVNQALNAGDIDNMLVLCEELQKIGEFAERMIITEIRKRKTQN